VRELLHKDEVGGAFREGEYRASAVLAHDGVHLLFAKARAVGLGWPVVYAYAARDILYFCRAIWPAVAVVLHLVAAVGGQLARIVSAYVLVNQLVGDVLALPPHIACHLLGRPVIVPYVL